LAGVPAPVLVRAAQILHNLPPEDGSTIPAVRPMAALQDPQLDLFAPEDQLRLTLQSLDIDRLTPLEALNTLAKLKEDSSS